jgi:RNA polymerase sigma-70 factor (ECF subfamily)
MESIGASLKLVDQDCLSPASEAETGHRDFALIQAAQRGEPWALEQLYHKYAPMVHGVLLARIPSDHVDDLVQDVFMQAFNKLGSLRAAGAFGGWLVMIARNRATDFHRRNKHTEEISESIAQRRSMKAEAAEALEAIRTLPESYSETLILRLVEGMTGPEIADRTGLTPASVRVNLHRGMKMLREKLGLEVKS